MRVVVVHFNDVNVNVKTSMSANESGWPPQW